MGLRLEQQRKFYDSEREQRRQREMELQQLKKQYQDAANEWRQKERGLAQQVRVNEEDLARMREREATINSRLEQLQAAYTAAVNRSGANRPAG